MNNYVLVSEKDWHNDLFESLKKQVNGNWIWIREREEFTDRKLSALNPTWVFIPHWSYIIPKGIYDTFTCVVFHMTDLPFGRGGSPLQNLIVRGFKNTMISAIHVSAGMDTGAIYLKKPLTLEGTAQEIFIRSAEIIKNMIVEIIDKNPLPIEQSGEVVEFKRRKPEEGDISKLSSLTDVYDYIRMLDAESYPHAFVDIGNLRIEFTSANLVNDSLTAYVRITKK